MVLKKENTTFYKELKSIAVPIALQCAFQSSFSLVDQIMVGQLGSISIAGSGIAVKYSSLVTVTLSAISTVAAIMIAQYWGNKDEEGMNVSFFSNLYIAIGIAILFLIPSLGMTKDIMRIYTKDAAIYLAGAKYLWIIALSFVPMAITMVISALLRTLEKSKWLLYGSIVAMMLNIVGNYFFIFGNGSCPEMGIEGAALATLIARVVEMSLQIGFILVLKKKKQIILKPLVLPSKAFLKKVIIIVLPILVCEFLWSLGENIYAGIYGRLGRDALAAMTLTSPVQGLLIGLFSGVSVATVVMVGGRLGKDDYEGAYAVARKLLKIGVIGSLGISMILLICARFYGRLFNVTEEVSQLTCYILYSFSFVLFAKIANMILGGGILRSGGNTKLTLIIDIIGTWGFGIPLGFLAAFIWHLPIYLVYFILSLEELVRLGLSLILFKKRKWMKNIT